MKRVLILGGTGATGKLVAHHLLESTDAAITIAARNLERMQGFADDLNSRFPGERIKTVYADASAPLHAVFADHDIVVVTAPTTVHAENVIRAALDSGVDYLDVQIGKRKLELLQSLAGEIAQRGRCFITEAGFHPGLPSLLVRFAAAHFDRLDSAVTAGFLNMGTALPYTGAFDEIAEIMSCYSGQVLKDGVWTKPSDYEFRKIDFGGDIGMRKCVSMYFEELRDLPAQIPSLRETGFYMSETHWITDGIFFPLAMLWLKLAPHSVRFCGKMLWWAMHRFHRPPYRVELQVQAQGEHAGQNTAVQVAVSHADGYELTAIPVVATLLQVLDGTARKPGLWMMGHLPEPRRMMNDMKRMGIRVSTLIQ